MSIVRTQIPAVDGWFTTGEQPSLIGSKCPDCGTYVFPPRPGSCPNPDCEATALTPTELSRRGRIWSYAENRYPPPPPFVAADPFVPYALAAVELEHEGLVILGQVAKGVLAVDLRVGMEMEVGIDILHSDAEHDHMIWVWEPAAPSSSPKGS